MIATPDIALDLTQFLDQSPTAFHAAHLIMERLRSHGFRQLQETDRWNLEPAQGYFVQRNSSAVIAWNVAAAPQPPTAYAIALSHLDSPGLRLKVHSLRQDGNTLIAPVEKYSSNIDTTWLDHPLTVAGRIILTSGEERLIAFPNPIAVIPNVAIHLQRDVNQGISLNPQRHLSAFLGNATPQDFIGEIARLVHCTTDDLAELELSLVDATPAAITGLAQTLVNAPRLDNLMAAHAMLVALENTPAPEHVSPVAFFADNEEIGSNTMAGADSDFLKDTLARINLALNGTPEDAFRAVAASNLLSIDAAHAYHPNYPEKYDPVTAPKINQGIALKTNPNGRYITNAQSAAQFHDYCRKANIRPQLFASRADMPCGSTVGPMTSARLGIGGVDLGVPMWAMHSVRETAGLNDQVDMIQLLKAFWSD